MLKKTKKLRELILKGIFAAEGYIYSTRINEAKIRWRIGLEQYKIESLRDEGKKYMEQIRTSA